MGDYRHQRRVTFNEHDKDLEKKPLLHQPEDSDSIQFRGPKPGVLELAVMIYYAVMVTTQPVLQQYIYHRILNEEKNHTHENTTAVSLPQSNGSSGHCGKNSSSREEESAQQQASLWTMAIGAAATLPGIFSTILVGAYVDLKGRKLGMLLPVSGSMLKFTSILLVVGLDWPLPIIVVGAFLEGCSGFVGAMIAAVFSYIADITEPGKGRTFRITILQGVVAMAVAISNITTGYFIKATGYFFPVLATLCLLVIALIIIVVFIPESISKRSDKSIFQCATLRNSLKTFIKPRQGGKRWILVVLLMALVLHELVIIGKMEISILFEMLFPFCWDSVKIGIYGFLSQSSRIAAMVLLIRLFQKCASDTVIAMIGLVSGIAEYLIFGLAKTETMIFLSAAAGILFQFPAPLFKSIMSAIADPEEQGSLFAGVGVLQALGSVIGVLTFNPIYRATVAFMPGFVFVLMTGMLIGALLLLTLVVVFGGSRTATAAATTAASSSRA